MFFVSTRGQERVTGAQAVVRGIASDGGLFVPESFPQVTPQELEEMCGMDFAERTAFVLGKFFDEYDGAELLEACRKQYARFPEGDAAPLVRMDNGMYMLELFHGPTCAFQDISFAVMPHLLRKGRELLGIRENVLLLVATGGDTGMAALDMFRDEPDVKLAVFYPDDGVSKMQKLQLCTADGENVDVVAVRGTFDDCQTVVKRILHSENDKTLLKERGYLLSTANSANIGRIVPQIACYFSAYCDLLTSDQIVYGDAVDFCAPSGNFGNLLSVYYAKRMGLPVGKIVCACNKNGALADFLTSGNYNAKRPLYRTMSSSMDVLMPAEQERLVFELSGRDTVRTAERMGSLARTGRYSVTPAELSAARANFYADSTDEDGTVECIYDFFMDYGYPMDTRTGVAMSVAQRYSERCKKDDPKAIPHPMVVVSTASPYKFPQDVLYALTGNDVKDSFKGVKRIHLLTAMKVPESLKAIRYKPPRFKTTVGADKMFEEIKKFIG